MDRDEVEVHKHAKGSISSHLDGTSSANKQLFYGKRTPFSCGTRRVIPNGQDSAILPAWLPERAGWSYLARSELPAVSRTKHFPEKPYNKSFIDQACSIKMAGYWPRSFFASLWTSTPSRSINTQKKNLANIQPSWPHTWSITHTYSVSIGPVDILSMRLGLACNGGSCVRIHLHKNRLPALASVAS